MAASSGAGYLNRELGVQDETAKFIHNISNKLKVCVRPVQSGKTFVCIQEISKSLNDNPNNLHIIATMNTILSNNQFASRVIKNKTINPIIFNSKKDEITLPDSKVKKYSHTQNIHELLTQIGEHDINVIIICCHINRITNMKSDGAGIMRIISYLAKVHATKNIIIHIDEIHKYISRRFRCSYELFAEQTNVTTIYGYTATPKPLYCDRDGWRYLQLIDQRHFVINKEDYFGVNEHEVCLIDEKTINYDEIPLTLTSDVIDKANYKGKFTNFVDYHPFLGKEMKTLKNIDHILDKKIKLNEKKGTFYKMFIPACKRRVTHYQITNIVRRYLPNASILTINGVDKDGIGGIILNYIEDTQEKIKKLELSDNKELNSIINDEFKSKPFLKENPFIITGFQCIGMSVSLVHPDYGNFDSIILTQDWINNEDTYQFMRTNFSKKRWSKEEQKKIIKTKLYTIMEVFNKLSSYEDLGFRMHSIKGEYSYEDVGIEKSQLKRIKQKKVTIKKRHFWAYIKEGRYNGTDIKKINKRNLQKSKSNTYIKKYTKFIDNKYIASYHSLAVQNKIVTEKTCVEITHISGKIYHAIFEPENFCLK